MQILAIFGLVCEIEVPFARFGRWNYIFKRVCLLWDVNILIFASTLLLKIPHILWTIVNRDCTTCVAHSSKRLLRGRMRQAIIVLPVRLVENLGQVGRLKSYMAQRLLHFGSFNNVTFLGWRIQIWVETFLRGLPPMHSSSKTGRSSILGYLKTRLSNWIWIVSFPFWWGDVLDYLMTSVAETANLSTSPLMSHYFITLARTSRDDWSLR